ncbi:hypothetical protein ACHAXS_010157 [Conticribra weissflogii]
MVSDYLEEDEGAEWIPPDHSPLTEQNKFPSPPDVQRHSESIPPPPGSQPVDSDDEISELDEIELIDLEATLKNEANKKYISDSSEYDSRDPSLFNVEVEDVDWNEILRDLKESGEEDMLKALVREYGLQDHLDAMQMEAVDFATLGDDDIEEDRDKEFYKSLENLSDDDLVDELIENSPYLCELEMEIMSQEMQRSGQTDDDDLDLSESEVYRDFRSMVLEEHKEKMEKMKKATSSKPVNTAMNRHKSSAKSDFDEYPPDWKDYDSKSAFQRDFLDQDLLVPPAFTAIPSKPKAATSSMIPPKEHDANDFDNTIDWLQARRSRLGGAASGGDVESKHPSHLLTPKEAHSFRHQNSQIPIVLYTLLTPSEVSSSLSAQGGTDIRIIDTSEYDSKYGVTMGCNYLLIVTGRNSSHIRVLAESVVRNLKARKLNERGVVGASKGVEGGQDIFSTKRGRNRNARVGGTSTSAKVDDSWMVVDCGNIHVHILERVTRECLNIEGLWDLSNPNSEGSKLRRLNLNDEDQVDTYVAENPVPEEYASTMLGGPSWVTGGVGGRVVSIPPADYKRKSFSEKWSGGKKSKSRNRRGRP